MIRCAYPAAPVTIAFLRCKRPISKLLMVCMPLVGGLLEAEDILAAKTDNLKMKIFQLKN
jgi:hypothetical protein